MITATPSLSHLFIVPDIAGAVTGGTLFNRELVAGLAARGLVAETLDLAATPAAFRSAREQAGGAPHRFYWVDSLYLDELPRLRRLVGPGHPLGLLLHYLPSLVTRGSEIAPPDISAGEAAALEQADVVLVTSAFMRSTAVRWGARSSQVLVVEPGRLAAGVAAPAPQRDRLRAVIVANLVPGKGIEPFLLSLQDELADTDQFRLTILGSHEMDAPYARACREAVARSSRLGSVELPGAVAPESAIAQIAASDLMVSASVMEAYGMALAEARTLGIPILARRGGNVEHMIDDDAGGELVSDHHELARAFVRLGRDRLERARRVERARRHAWQRRSWEQAADEFIVQSRCLVARGSASL